MSRLSTVRSLAAETIREWREDKASRLAAALSYYTIFSLSPLLVISLAIAGRVFDRASAQQQVLNQAEHLIGETGAEAIGQLLDNAADPAVGSLAALLSVGILLFAASGAFVQLHDALNTVWDVTTKPGHGLVATLWKRFLSFTMVLAVGFLLLVSLVLSTVLAALGEWVSQATVMTVWVARVLNAVISFVAISGLFALIFRYVPDVRVAWRDVWLGAVLTAVMFTIGKWGIGLYLGQSAAASAYGAAGSVVVLLIWVYYSAQILFLGAEFTQVYARRCGSGMEPDRHAIPLTAQARAKQGIPRVSQVKKEADRQ